ncbi:hypothetical protein [Dokdonella sp.]|uniref:porin n=1 Tax=Dokdonella sp. TaxID=2291710 RepID=UPI001B0FEA3E|nr:hypothetical protein [Dokdonella sp.]MBO9661632.1 hypothetical protein [Dokdonella sp.]
MTVKRVLVRKSTLALACLLALPGAALADSKREAALEKRVDELERQLQELMTEVKAQRNAPPQIVQAPPPPPPAPAAPAKEAPPTFTTAPGLSVAFHGFVSATAFTQDKSFRFGNGQNAETPIPGSHGRTSGFDVRNTRFWLDITGAKLDDDWRGGGRIEMDFFGGFNGTGPYSRQQPTPRLRQAYLDLDNASTGSKIRIGQQWDLMFPLDNVPTSLSHLAFPLGYGAGFVGWRFPGVVWMQDLNHGGEGTKWRVDVGAFDGSWNGPGDNVNYLSAGNADFQPQIEARIRAQGEDWIAYAAGHYSKVDLRGVDGAAPTPIKSSLKSTGGEVGGIWKPGPWNFKALVYGGKGLGQIFGNLSQFGDIGEVGGFAQAGYSFTKHWSANAFYAYQKSDEDDVVRWIGNGSTGLLKSRQAALGVQYASGPYQLGIEWLHAKLDSTNAALERKTTSGNQLSLSALYTF